MNLPSDFAKMADQEKFKFLHLWCENLSRAMKEAQSNAQSFHERLRVAEARLAEIDVAPKP